MKRRGHDVKESLAGTVFKSVMLQGDVDGLASVSVRQLLASGAVTVLDMAVYYGLIRLAGLGILLSAAVSFCLALALNYVLASVYVFRHRSGGNAWRPDRFALYAFFALVSLGLNQAIIWLVSVRFLFHPLLGKSIAVGLLFFWNQWVSRRIIFNGKMAEKTSGSD